MLALVSCMGSLYFGFLVLLVLLGGDMESNAISEYINPSFNGTYIMLGLLFLLFALLYVGEDFNE